MKKHFALTTVMMLLWLLVGQQAANSQCLSNLQSDFDWAKKGQLSGSGDFKKYAAVYATVTIHSPKSNPTSSTVDQVQFGNGVLELKLENGQEVLTGYIQAWWNQPTYKTYPPNPPPFPYNAHLGFKVTISKTGTVSILRLIDGKAYLGRPPVVFNGTCTNGLITNNTFNTPSGGTESITVSLTQGEVTGG